MGIFDRMSRVISSNFNALLDDAEDPAKSLAQTLKDMDKQLRLAKSELVRAVAAERQLKRKVEELEEELLKWEKRAELAVQNGDDGLARDALRQKRRVADELERTQNLRVQQRGNALEMKSTWEGMQSKFKDFSARKNTIAARATQARAGGKSENLGGGGDAFTEFAAIEERIDGVDDVMDAQREVDQMLSSTGPTGMSRSEVELKFAELEGRAGGDVGSDASSSDLDAELSELKQRVRVRVK